MREIDPGARIHLRILRAPFRVGCVLVAATLGRLGSREAQEPDATRTRSARRRCSRKSPSVARRFQVRAGSPRGPDSASVITRDQIQH